MKRFVIFLLVLLGVLSLSAISTKAYGVGSLEIEPLYEPTLTFVNDDLGEFNNEPYLRRLKTNILENSENFLEVDTIQTYDEVTSGGEQVLISLQGAIVTFSASLMYDEFSNNTFNVTTRFPDFTSYGTSSSLEINSQGTMYFNINEIDNIYIYSNFVNSVWRYNNPDLGSSNLGSFLRVEFTNGNDLTNSTLIDLVNRYSSSIEGGIYEGGETSEEVSFLLNQFYSRDENFTHSNYWGITSNYVINNHLSLPNTNSINSLILNYSDIVVYDEFIVNYALLNYSLIPTSIVVNTSDIESIVWEWEYYVQTDTGVIETRSSSWSLLGQDLLDNKINLLPQIVLYNVSIDELNAFMDTYSQNQFINIKQASVNINFNTDVNEFDIIQYSIDKDVYNESNEFAWYDFENMSNFGDIGQNLSTLVSNFLNTQIFPNFTILNLLLIVIAIPLLIYILKLFLGG